MRVERGQISFELIQKAQQGDQESRSQLLVSVKGRVHAYLCRLTMDEHLAEDLCQETLLSLVRALGRLRFADEKAFWGWIYRTALGMTQHHFRIQGNKRITHKMRVDAKLLSQLAASQDAEPDKGLWRQEVVRIILGAMGVLTTEYRAVLTLRCFEDLSYAQIAAILGGTQLRNKLLFYRARNALRHELSRQGLKRSHFFGALTVFSALTAYVSQRATAASSGTVPVTSTVAAGSLEVGWSATVLGTVTSKVGLIGLGMVLAVVGVVSMVSPSDRGRGSALAGSLPLRAAAAPRPDNTLGLAFDEPRLGYTKQRQIGASSDPDGDGWRCFAYWPRLEPAQPIETITDRPDDTMLVLGKDHWVEYRLTGTVRAHPGAEVVIQVWTWGAMPTFTITDGDQNQRVASPTSCGGHYPRGFMVLGFDLGRVERPFEIRGFRITGLDEAGPSGGCGIGPITAYVETER